MRRAQISQVIVYVLAIVIFSMVLVFGYRAFMNVRQQTEQASYLNFQKSLEADINSIYFDYGSVKEKSYSVGGYSEVCFADLTKSVSAETNNIVKNSIESGVKKNVFSVNGKIDSFYVDKMGLTNPLIQNPLCIAINNGKLNLKLTGKGDYALVEYP